MYTFCPSCQTIFRLTTRHLARAGGYTRCGECRRVYNAIDYLYDELAETREAQKLGRQSGQDQAEAGAQEPVVDVQAASDRDDPVPEQVPVLAGGWSQRTLTSPGVFSSAVIVFLALFLAGQWVFFNRADLAQEQSWRPVLEQLCKYLRCSLPLLVDLSQLELLNRDVRKHPGVEEALLVNATLSNQADFTQPYPVLEVSFSDLGGNPVALRRFRPEEYVNDTSAIKHGMPPREPLSIRLEIQDPGESAVSYQFGFL